jgi:hypothetical protein
MHTLHEIKLCRLVIIRKLIIIQCILHYKNKCNFNGRNCIKTGSDLTRVSSSYSSSFSSMGATVHDEPWSLLRMLSIDPDPVIFVSKF